MPWFKVDDGLPSSRKVLSIPRALRCSAMGLWSMAGAWCMKELTDGRLPTFMVEEIGGTQEMADALVKCGMWDMDGDDYLFHDWADYQPSRDDVIEKRQKNADRLRVWREKNAGRNGVTNTATNNGSNNVSTRSPTRPDPTRPDPLVSTTSETADAVPDLPIREDVERVCRHLADKIAENGSRRPRITKAWRDEARRLIDNDERTEDQVHRAIDWCQGDSFWRANILSMPTFREKYDQMRLAAQRPPNGTNRPPPGGLDLTAAMARAQARDAQKGLTA